MSDNLFVIQEMITGFKDIKKEDIALESDIAGDLALDSAERVELALCVEETFNVSIPPEKQEECETIHDLIKLIEKQQNPELKMEE